MGEAVEDYDGKRAGLEWQDSGLWEGGGCGREKKQEQDFIWNEGSNSMPVLLK